MISQKQLFQRFGQKAIAPFIALSLVGYFVYHSIQGDRGILAWVHIQERLSYALTELNTVIKERQELEEKVQALRPESLNRDLLDQQVRQTLGYTHPNEIVILRLDKKEKT